jgi:hypothetical protein
MSKGLRFSILILYILVLILLYKYYYQDWFKSGKILQISNLNDIQHILSNSKYKTVSIDNFNRKTDYILDMSNCKNMILDLETNTISVEYGCTIGEINNYLKQYDLCLPDTINNLNTMIGYAISTAQSGYFGTLCDIVMDITCILPNGHIRKIEYKDYEYSAFVPNIGKIGIIYSFTLRCENIFSIEEINILYEGLIKDIEILPNTFLSKIKCIDINKYILTFYKKVSEYIKNSPPNIEKLVAIDSKYIDIVLKNNVEVIFNKADNISWLSPSSGCEIIWIDINTVPDNLKELCRPNWLNIHQIPLCYGLHRIKYFNSIRDRYDPNHKIL